MWWHPTVLISYSVPEDVLTQTLMVPHSWPASPGGAAAASRTPDQWQPHGRHPGVYSSVALTLRRFRLSQPIIPNATKQISRFSWVLFTFMMQMPYQTITRLTKLPMEIPTNFKKALSTVAVLALKYLRIWVCYNSWGPHPAAPLPTFSPVTLQKTPSRHLIIQGT